MARELQPLLGAAEATPSLDTIRELLHTAREIAGDAGAAVDVAEVMLRIEMEEDVAEYLRQAYQMMELLLPFRDLGNLYPHNFVPPFLTKERLKLAWEQVSQLRGLLPQSYCQPHKVDRHVSPFAAFDALGTRGRPRASGRSLLRDRDRTAHL